MKKFFYSVTLILVTSLGSSGIETNPFIESESSYPAQLTSSLIEQEPLSSSTHIQHPNIFERSYNWFVNYNWLRFIYVIESLFREEISEAVCINELNACYEYDTCIEEEEEE